MKEKIENINIDLLIPFENHPFKERNGIEQTELLDGIKKNGLLEPLIVRPFSGGKYEIISGHRRVNACKELGIQTVPAIVKELNKDEAVIAMVDANLQREHLLPSEKAFAYKMKLEAIKHQGIASSQLGTRLIRSDEKVALDAGESRNQIQRYIRLTYLIPELLKMVDENKITFTPAVEISYLPEKEQKILFDEIEYADATPSLSQAQRLRGFSRQGRLNADVIFTVMSKKKANQKEQIRFPKEEIQKYFPKSYTGKDMQNTILKLLEKWRRQREKQRDER